MSNESNNSRQRQGIPWIWLGLGLVATIAACLVGYFVALSFLSQPPEKTAIPPEVTVIVLTAPASPTAPPTGQAQPPTPFPTFTPIPTPDTLCRWGNHDDTVAQVLCGGEGRQVEL